MTTTCGARSPRLGGSAAAVNGASPRPGALTNAAVLPSGSCWVGPSPPGAAAVTTTSLAANVAALATTPPSGARSARRAVMRCSRSAATRSNTSSASAWTQAIDEPGRMSWNCWVSTSRHVSSSSWASTSAPPIAAVAAHNSVSRSSRSHRRLPSFVRSWLVSVPRWVSKYSSPRHAGTGAPPAASASTWSKNRAAEPSSTCGIGSRSARRAARASISRVGPPPPSP